MNELLGELWSRPLAALLAGLELLGPRLPPRLRIDGMVGRLVHILSRAPSGPCGCRGCR